MKSDYDNRCLVNSQTNSTILESIANENELVANKI